LEKVVEQGDDVFVQYKAITKDGKEFRNVERLSFIGDRIRAANVYFGATYKDGKFIRQPEASYAAGPSRYHPRDPRQQCRNRP
jgi:hypothetical protein